MRFALSQNDRRIRELVTATYREDVPVAATWRAVGEAAQGMGLPRPSYELVRRLAQVERLRRKRLAALRRARLEAAGAFFFSPRVVDFPIALERVEDAKRDVRLVTQSYKESLAPAEGDGDEELPENR